MVVFLLFSLAPVFGQSVSKTENEKSDSTVYFYANLPLKNGLFVLSDSDSLVVNKRQVVSELASFRAANITTLLKTAKAQIGSKDMVLKNPDNSRLILIFGSEAELNESLNSLKTTNRNSLYYLRDFKFKKQPTLLGPGNPVIK